VIILILYKSFWRKKITKTYIILFILILFSIIILSSINNHYLEILNKKYQDSYISISLNEKDKPQKMKNIKIYNESLLLETNDEFNNYLTLTKNTNLKNTEIILPICYSNKYKINDNYNLTINNNTYSFFIKDFYDTDMSNELKISSKIYEKLSQEVIMKEYKLKLDNWLKIDKTISKIKNKLNINQEYGLKYFKINNEDKTKVVIYIINIFIYIMFISFFIIYTISLINIYSDEGEKNKILNSLGYKHNKIMRINYLKILSLISISTIFSIFLFYSIKIILLLFNINIYFNWLIILYIIIISIIINVIYNNKFSKKIRW